MKKIKWIIGMLLFAMSLAFCGELYQSYIGTFSNQFYYFDVNYTAAQSKQVLDLIKDVSREYNTPVFAAVGGVESARQYYCDIYADQEAISALDAQYDIHAGTFKSFFSGKSEIDIHDLEEFVDHPEIKRFYFMGTSKTVNKIREKVASSFGCSFYHKEDTTGNEWIIYFIWGISCLFLLIITWFDIQFQKKKAFVQISLGASKSRIIMRNIVLDILVFVVEITAAVFIFKNYISLEYHFTTIIGIIILFLFCNSLLYLDILRYHYKEILYGANLNQSLLANCYVMKAITLIIALASLSINITSVASYGKYLALYHSIEKLGGYDFASITPDTSAAQKEFEDDEIHTATIHQFFLDCYCENKIALACSDMLIQTADGEKPLIMLNQNSDPILSQQIRKSIQEADTDADFYIFMPENTGTENDLLDSVIFDISINFGIPEEKIEYQMIQLSDNCKQLYFDISKSQASVYGFDQINDTVCVYCNIQSEKLREISDVDEILCDKLIESAMFILEDDDKQAFMETYNLSRFTAVSVIERCSEYKAAIARIVMMNSSISVFILLIEFCIIMTIVKLEYIVHAKELSLKKILGYSVFQKNKMIFLMNIFAAFIGIGTNLIIHVMYGIMNWKSILLIGITLLLIELLVILNQIYRFEKTNVSKILKGGSL